MPDRLAAAVQHHVRAGSASRGSYFGRHDHAVRLHRAVHRGDEAADDLPLPLRPRLLAGLQRRDPLLAMLQRFLQKRPVGRRELRRRIATPRRCPWRRPPRRQRSSAFSGRRWSMRSVSSFRPVSTSLRSPSDRGAGSAASATMPQAITVAAAAGSRRARMGGRTPASAWLCLRADLRIFSSSPRLSRPAPGGLCRELRTATR